MTFQVLDIWIDNAGGIHRIAPAVDDEQRLVQQVVGKEIAVGFSRFALQDHDEAVERQEARERRRFPHRRVISAGSAVGDTGQHDTVLVDVVRPLHHIENRTKVVDLAAAPPRCVSPGVRHDVDLFGARQACVRSGARRCVGLDAADAAMELDADLVFACRVVALRNVECVEVLTTLAAIAPLHDSSGHVARVDAALPEASERLVESDSARDDLIGGVGGFARSTSVKERRECGGIACSGRSGRLIGRQRDRDNRHGNRRQEPNHQSTCPTSPPPPPRSVRQTWRRRSGHSASHR